MMRPLASTYPSYFENYISKAEGINLIDAIHLSTDFLLQTVSDLQENKGNFAYASGKWTIKQVLIHIADAERVFSYRLMRFLRADPQQPLPFDENSYAENCNATDRTLQSVIEELIAVRNSTLALIRSITSSDLNKTGNTSAGQITVNALGFVICGHSTHHLQILKARYS